MAGSKDNRTEKPTSRRLQKARDKGQVARSRDVPAAAVFIGSILVLNYCGTDLLSALAIEMRDIFRTRVPSEITIPYVTGLVHSSLVRTGLAVGTVMVAATVCSLAANLFQSGFVISWDPLRFHVEKLNPASGFSRIFSKSALMELSKSLLMMVVVVIICYQVVSQHTSLYPRLVLMDVRQLLYWTVSISYQVLCRVAIFLAILAAIDYAFQKHRFRDQLKMTKQEVKDEHRDMEGDPLIRGRIRRIQREMARKRMMADVPTADVVITNPTHYAVALSYKMESMEAPKVVAKGVGFLALKIRELAQEHRIPLVENKSLAQTLFKTVEIGELIPAALYRAVAEILAYIYKARQAYQR